MTPKQKEYFFRVLLEKLNSSMCGSCFPSGGGAQPLQSQSSMSLPQIHGRGTVSPQHSKHDEQGHFSQFLWSVASHGGQAGGQAAGHSHQHDSHHGSYAAPKEMATKSCQTETTSADPALREGLWNPATRMGFSQTVTPSVVGGGLRNWGPKARTQRARGGMGSSRLV
jgi:hypothetical protein